MFFIATYSTFLYYYSWLNSVGYKNKKNKKITRLLLLDFIFAASDIFKHYRDNKVINYTAFTWGLRNT